MDGTSILILGPSISLFLSFLSDIVFSYEEFQSGGFLFWDPIREWRMQFRLGTNKNPPLELQMVFQMYQYVYVSMYQ